MSMEQLPEMLRWFKKCKRISKLERRKISEKLKNDIPISNNPHYNTKERIIINLFNNFIANFKDTNNTILDSYFDEKIIFTIADVICYIKNKKIKIFRCKPYIYDKLIYNTLIKYIYEKDIRPMIKDKSKDDEISIRATRLLNFLLYMRKARYIRQRLRSRKIFWRYSKNDHCQCNRKTRS